MRNECSNSKYKSWECWSSHYCSLGTGLSVVFLDEANMVCDGIDELHVDSVFTISINISVFFIDLFIQFLFKSWWYSFWKFGRHLIRQHWIVDHVMTGQVQTEWERTLQYDLYESL